MLASNIKFGNKIKRKLTLQFVSPLLQLDKDIFPSLIS